MMKTANFVAAATGLLLVAMQAAHAEPANSMGQTEVSRFCRGFGTFFPGMRINHGVYGCLMNEDQGGGLLICSPGGDLKPPVCDVYDKVPPHKPGHLPTLAEMNAAARADPSILSPNPHSALMRRLGRIAHPKKRHS